MTNRGAKMFGISTYHGTNPQFWSCRFRGEDGQDAGGLFRDCISNIAEELMSNRTPCLLQSGSELLGKCWVPNPSCHDVQMYKFLGQIMGACIRTGETLAVVCCIQRCTIARTLCGVFRTFIHTFGKSWLVLLLPGMTSQCVPTCS